MLSIPVRGGPLDAPGGGLFLGGGQKSSFSRCCRKMFVLTTHITKIYVHKGENSCLVLEMKKMFAEKGPPPPYTIRFQLEMALQTTKENAQSTQCTRISVNLCQGGHHRLLAMGECYWEDCSRTWSVAGVVRLTSTVSLWSVWPAQDYYMARAPEAGTFPGL